MGKSVKFYISKGLRKYLNPPAIRDSSIDKTAVIWDHSTVSDSQIGRYTYVSDHTLIVHTHVGAFCSISSSCQIGAASHPINFVSTSPLFFKGHNAFGKNFAETGYKEYEQTLIGNDVWIGAGCYIKSGVRIGDGAVVGAHSVVTHDVEPYTVVAGVPAHPVRKRFDGHIIRQLLNLAWWNWPDAKIAKYAPYFSHPEVLIQKAGGDL